MSWTPTNVERLNMIEIEFSALARQCLNRRISTMREVGQEVISYFKERTEQRIKINWQFTKETARKKLKKHYIKVNPMNSK